MKKIHISDSSLHYYITECANKLSKRKKKDYAKTLVPLWFKIKIMRVKKSFRNLLPTDILISSKIMSVAINNQSKIFHPANLQLRKYYIFLAICVMNFKKTNICLIINMMFVNSYFSKVMSCIGLKSFSCKKCFNLILTWNNNVPTLFDIKI